MTDPVFFVPAVPPAGEFHLDGDEGRHAAAVKRLRAGEKIVVADGCGTWAPATVTANRGRSLTLAVGLAAHDEDPELRITTVQALPKGERSDLAVELATEAGADDIVPWQAERCVARWDKPSTTAGDKADRGRQKWQKVAREAAKQARRHRIPRIGELATTDDVVELIGRSDGAVILHEAGSRPLTAAPLPRRGRLVLVVGPEGGLTDAEVSRFEAAGATAVRLGPEVLRTSTAAAVALGALGVLTGRWAETSS